MEKYVEINSKTIDRWNKEGWIWGQPITEEEFLNAKKGDWKILLTPVKPMPKEWIGKIDGKEILGLASGGAQQMPILTALGGNCTLMDITPSQLKSDIDFAAKHNYLLKAVKADMTQPFPFADSSFDIIINPVSNCYIESLESCFRECYRTLKKGGIFIMGFNNANPYAFDNDGKLENKLPFNPLRNPELMKKETDFDNGVQFSHSLGEEIGLPISLGFRLTDIYEDIANEGTLASYNVPEFAAVRFVKE